MPARPELPASPCWLSMVAMNPPPTMARIPKQAHKPPRTNQKIEIAVTPPGLTIRIPPLQNALLPRIVSTVWTNQADKFSFRTALATLECHGFRHSPVWRTAGAAGDKSANAVGEIGGLKCGPLCVNAMHQGGGKGVPGPNGISHLN